MESNSFESNSFERNEFKYLITKDQMNDLLFAMSDFMENDEYPKSTIKNIYFDTDSYLLVRRSLEAPIYKEKLRIRSYGETNENTKVFVEIKKKFESVVYKRRVEIQESDINGFMSNNRLTDSENQISREINYFMKFYNDLKPKGYLSYDRLAFRGKEDINFRITFDHNVLFRDYDIDLKYDPYGEKVLSEDMIILEVKTLSGLPSWLIDFLTKNRIYKQSFSKYGESYKKFVLKERLGGVNNAS